MLQDYCIIYGHYCTKVITVCTVITVLYTDISRFSATSRNTAGTFMTLFKNVVATL